MDYKKAGVDIEAGYKSVELMKKYVKETMRPEVMGGLGGFPELFQWQQSRIWRTLYFYPERTESEPRSSLHLFLTSMTQ